MTRAVLYKDAHDRFTGFSVKGHSGYAEAGSDIVCAAVSILTTTCINALESVAGVTPEVEGGEDAYLAASLPHDMPEACEHDAQVLFKALHQGLSDLAETCPGYFKLSIQKRREIP